LPGNHVIPLPPVAEAKKQDKKAGPMTTCQICNKQILSTSYANHLKSKQHIENQTKTDFVYENYLNEKRNELFNPSREFTPKVI
jgi:hypothetical protein